MATGRQPMIIARRTLHWKSQAGAADIEVRIFRPEEIDGCWRCRYEIDWPDRKRAFSGAGYDCMQALHATLQMIGSEIVASGYYQAGEISLDGDYRGRGFPVPPNIRDCLRDDDARFG